MFKKIILLFFILFTFSLTSCFDEEEELKENKTLHQKIDRKDFSILLPGNWDVIKSNNSIFPKPAYGEIILDAVSKKRIDDFYRNILILKEKVGSNINSIEYITSNYIGAKDNYYYFRKIRVQDTTLDNKKTKIYIFEAKYSEDTPLLKFLQTGLVCDNQAYVLTVALEKNNNNVDRYLNLLRTFKCKKQK